MPALELAQETGKVLRWMKAPGDKVRKGEPIVEIETDKVTVEIESPASGILSHVTAHEGDVIPVGHTIALIAEPGAAPVSTAPLTPPSPQRGEGERPRSTLSPMGRGQGEGSGVEGAGGEGPRGEGVKPPRWPAASPRSTPWTSRASRPPAARSRRPTCSRSWRAGRRRRAMAGRWYDLSRPHRRRGGSRWSAGWI